MSMKRAYVRSHKAYYGPSNEFDTPEVLIGCYDTDGNIQGEIKVVWCKANGANSGYRAQINVDEAQWHLINSLSDLFFVLQEMDCREIDEETFCEILNQIDIYDVTEYEKGKPATDLSKVKVKAVFDLYNFLIVVSFGLAVAAVLVTVIEHFFKP